MKERGKMMTKPTKKSNNHSCTREKTCSERTEMKGRGKKRNTDSLTQSFQHVRKIAIHVVTERQFSVYNRTSINKTRYYVLLWLLSTVCDWLCSEMGSKLVVQYESIKSWLADKVAECLNYWPIGWMINTLADSRTIFLAELVPNHLTWLADFTVADW